MKVLPFIAFLVGLAFLLAENGVCQEPPKKINGNPFNVPAYKPPQNTTPRPQPNKPGKSIDSWDVLDYDQIWNNGVVKRKLNNSAGDVWAKYLATLTPAQKAFVQAEAQRQYEQILKDVQVRNTVLTQTQKQTVATAFLNWLVNAAVNGVPGTGGTGGDGEYSGTPYDVPPSDVPQKKDGKKDGKNPGKKEIAKQNPPAPAKNPAPPPAVQSRVTGVVFWKDGSVAKNLEVTGVWGGQIDGGVTAMVRTDDRGRFTLSWNNGRWLTKVWVEPGVFRPTDEFRMDIRPGEDITIRLRKY